MSDCVCGQGTSSQVYRVGPTGRKRFSFLAVVCRCGRLYPLPSPPLTEEQQRWVHRWNRRILESEQSQYEGSAHSFR